MNRERSARMLDRALEVVLIALLVFAPLAFGSVEVWAREVLRLGGFLLAVLALARLAVAGSRPDRPTRIWLPIVLFLALVGLTLLPLPRSLVAFLSPQADHLYQEAVPGYSDGLPVDREAWLLRQDGQNTGSGEKQSPVGESASAPGWRTLSVYPYATFNELLLLLAHLTVFWVCFRFLDRRAVRRVAWTVAIVAMGIGLLGLSQGLAGSDKLLFYREAGPGVQPLGPFVNRNHFAGYMELAIPVILGILLGLLRRVFQGGTGSWRRLDTSSNELAKAGLLAFMVAVCLAALGFSFSRGAFLAVMVVLVVFLVGILKRGPGRAERWAAVLVLGGVLLAGVALAQPLLRSLARPGLETFTDPGAEPSWLGRWVAWKGTADMAAAYPLAGSGLGTYRHAFGPFTPPGSTGHWFQAHNDYLQIAAETGLVGALLILVGVILYLRRLFRRATGAKAGDRSLHFGLGLALLGLAIHSLVDFNLQIPSNGLTFAALAGMALALTGEGKDERDPAPSRSGPPKIVLAGMALLVAMAGLAYARVAVNKAAADRSVSRAIAATKVERFEQAVEQFDLSVLREPRSAGHWLAAAQSRVTLYDEREDATPAEVLAGWVRTALDAGFRVVDRNPGSSEGWVTLAELLFQRSRIPVPVTTLDLDALTAGPPAGDSRDLALARAAAGRALLVGPRNPQALGMMGFLVEVAGQREQASEYYRRASRCLPFPGFHFFLEPTPSRWVIESARAGALEALEKGTIRSRERVHRYWADYYLSLKWYPEAHEAYHAASREARSDFWKAMNLGWGGMVAYSMGDREEARADLEEAYAAGVLKHPIHLEILGRLLAEAGETREAMELLTRAMVLRPRVDIALVLAVQQETLGDLDRAERFLRQAINMDAQRPEPYRMLIDLLRRQGRTISAEEVERRWAESQGGTGGSGTLPADAP